MKNIRHILIIAFFLGFGAISAQQAYQRPEPGDGNYILARTYQTRELDSSLDIVYEDDIVEEIQYFDGLGRPSQTLGISYAPDYGDIVTPIEYDGFGRMEKEWLPFYTTEGTRGTYRTSSRLDAQSYYQQEYPNDFQGVPLLNVNAFSEKRYEASPLNRVLKQAAPGTDWAVGSDETDHTIGFIYDTNTHDPNDPNNAGNDNVRQFSVDFANNDTEAPSLANEGYYLEHQLAKVVTKDENHDSGSDHTTEEFTDKQGRVVLKRTYNNSERHDTYYVYDDFGNLTYVIPPLVDTSVTINQTVLEDLCYQYVYDDRNRLVEKQLPGKEREYIVYNKLDQPIMTQDAVQRANNEWLFTQYDAFGRVAYTGKATFSGNRPTVQDAVTDLPSSHVLWTERTVHKDSINNIGGKNVNYDINGYPQVADITEVLTVNYYDNYDFDRANEPSPPSLVFDASLDDRTKGLPTGSLIKVLTTNNWITTVTRYDDKARPIYVYSENAYLGTVDVVESDLDFVGKPLKVRNAHTRNSTTVVTIDNFIYDHVGRLLKQTQCIGDGTLGYSCGNIGAVANLELLDASITTSQTATSRIEVKATNNPVTLSGTLTLRVDPNAGGSAANEELIVYNSYDELGQLEAKKVGGSPNTTYALTDGLQTVDFTYNVRGWLKNINQDTHADNDLFNFTLSYNDPVNFGANENPTALYNGNISQVVWSTTSTNSTANPVSERYSFAYDALNRIAGATDNTGNYDVSNITYDKMGNIQSLTRDGWQNGSFSNMDVLDYDYGAGNQLTKVTDTGHKDYGFKETVTSGDDYRYDANGNMVMDKNKGIGTDLVDGIVYNHLNLPTSISLPSGTITYIYDATGTKLKKVANGAANATVTEYAGNFVYAGNASSTQLEFLNHPEGYITPDGQGGYDYVYQYKDHLGNVRLSYTDDPSNPGTPTIVEENNYYPFGLKHKGYNEGGDTSLGNDVANRWKFGGKELDNSLNDALATYDFGARNYNPELGRWMNIDPLADKYTNLSPYSYVANNVVNAIDPDGRLIIFVTGLLSVQGVPIGDWDDWIYPKTFYKTDVFRYWRTYNNSTNSFGKKVDMVNLFSKVHRDDNFLFTSGSNGWISQATWRHQEGKRAGKTFYRKWKKGKVELADDEAIRIVSHSQGGAYAAGFAEQLLTYKDVNGESLFNVEVIWYITPHQPGDIDHPRETTGFQYSLYRDAISSRDPIWLPNGGSSLELIKGVLSYYTGDIFSEKNAEGPNGNRGGHSVNDNYERLKSVLNDFCKNNPTKCYETTVEEQ